MACSVHSTAPQFQLLRADEADARLADVDETAAADDEQSPCMPPPRPTRPLPVEHRRWWQWKSGVQGRNQDLCCAPAATAAHCKAVKWAALLGKGLLVLLAFASLAALMSVGRRQGPSSASPMKPNGRSADTPRFGPGIRRSKKIYLKGAPPPSCNAAPAPLLLPVRPDVNYSALFMPAFHIASPVGTWMNDPNGLLDYGGVRHVFYQHNPVQPLWGPMHWGHVASRDLVRWVRLPLAMSPSRWWDQDGVFSGSAGVTQGEAGTPFMIYTGVLNYSRWGFYYQMQAMAVPENASDPLLIRWNKPDNNPLVMDIPPSGTHAQFRDPVTPWAVNRTWCEQQLPGLIPALRNKAKAPRPKSRRGLRGGGGAKGGADSVNVNEGPGPGGAQSDSSVLWLTTVGTLQQCVGSSALYVSEDLMHWQYAGTLMSQLAENFTEHAVCINGDGQMEEVPAGTKGFGGQCDQFGATCQMWECPDYFGVDGIQAFKFSDQVRGRPMFGADWYVLSDSATLNLSSGATFGDDGNDAFAASLAGERCPPRLLDYGTVYASKSFALQDGRRIWMGWVYEDSLGCTEMCGDGSPFILRHQMWQGMQTLPRHVTFDAASGTLHLFPVPELLTLREGPPLFAAARPLMLDTVAAAAAGSADDDGQQQDCGSAASGGAGSALAVLVPEQVSESGPRRRQLEVRASFALGSLPWQFGSGSVSAPFQAGIMLQTGNGTSTRIFLSGAATWAPSTGAAAAAKARASAVELQPTVTALDVVVDRSCSGGASSLAQHASSTNHGRETFRAGAGMPAGASWQGGAVPLPSGGLPAGNDDSAGTGGPCLQRGVGLEAASGAADDASGCWGTDPWGGAGAGRQPPSAALPLSLALWVDASVLEVFAMGGAGRVTSRVYPFEDGVAWGVAVFARCGLAGVEARAEVHELGSCWVDELGA